ncbi:MAG: tryptophan synthase subunit alpha [Balneolaceae bacterium]|nr:tryptophan synthase subunit alpha [Balneolaceae bacterium]
MSQTAATDRIARLFEQKGEEPVMSLFLTAGFPRPEHTVELVLGLEEHGADMVELGMPFSDPLADGPSIQYASNTALEQGVTMEDILEMVRGIRARSEMPLVLMGYINPVLRYGVERFCRDAAEAGADGLILPDLPPDEADLLAGHAEAHGLRLIFLVAPNTSDDRMRLIDERSRGFVYCVSVTGVTGAREGEEVARSVQRFIGRVKENITRNPIMIGFGIRSHEDARRVASQARGFIVGSALVDLIREHYPEEGWKDRLFAFVRSLKYGEPTDSNN